MNETEIKAATQPDLTELQEQYENLKSLVVSILLLVVVLSLTANIYLLRQVRHASADLSAIPPQARQMIADYNRVNAPAVRDFLNKITEYGRTHPDFVPILTKYGLKPAPAPGAPAGTATPPATPGPK